MNKVFYAVLASGIVFTASADSILKDGDMSGDIAGTTKFGAWVFDPRNNEGTTVSYDTSDFISKPQSLKIVSEGKKAFAMKQNLQLVPGKKYKISFQMKTEIKGLNGKTAGAVLNIWDGVNHWFPSRWITNSTPWTNYEKIFIAGPKADKESYMLLYVWNVNGTVWFDDVSITEVQ